MKKLVTFMFSLAVAQIGGAQDSSKAWHISVGLDIGITPVYVIKASDTSFNDALSLAPGISFSHKSGFAFGYSPKLVLGGATPGLYMHAVSVGLSQYDRSDFSYAATFSHYFFTGNSSVPYSPLTNELYTSFTYKKTWLRPGITAGAGFGTNTEVSPSTAVYDLGVSAGISHSFDWDAGGLSFSASPSIYLSAGTNDYFSFLTTTRYIGNSGKSVSIAKQGKAAAAAHKKSNGNSGAGTTTTQYKKLELTNVSFGLESSMELGNFTMRPELEIYVPVESAAGSGISSYWAIALTYKF
jgi:hypothetical protein